VADLIARGSIVISAAGQSIQRAYQGLPSLPAGRVVVPQVGTSDWSAFTGPLVVCGHTHVQFDIERNGTRIVNPGSVGLPNIRAGASWALLTDGDVELRTTEYDTDATAGAMRATAFPEAEEFAKTIVAPPTIEQLLEELP